MNLIGQGLRDENRLRTRLGEGEPGLHVLLGGTGEPAAAGAGLGASATVSRVARIQREVRLSGGGTGSAGRGAVETGREPYKYGGVQP